MEFKFTIQGEPEGKGRPKFSSVTRRTYTPKKTALAETEVRRCWEDAGSPRLPDVALGIEITTYVSRPKSHFKSDGKLSAKGLQYPQPHNKKPDLDNAIKLIQDALNSRAYKDDVQIVEVKATRKWAEWPSTEVRIYTYADQGQ